MTGWRDWIGLGEDGRWEKECTFVRKVMCVREPSAGGGLQLSYFISLFCCFITTVYTPSHSRAVLCLSRVLSWRVLSDACPTRGQFPKIDPILIHKIVWSEVFKLS